MGSTLRLTSILGKAKRANTTRLFDVQKRRTKLVCATTLFRDRYDYWNPLTTPVAQSLSTTKDSQRYITRMQLSKHKDIRCGTDGGQECLSISISKPTPLIVHMHMHRTQDPVLRTIPAMEELHGLEKNSQGVQVYVGVGDSQRRVILLCHPPPTSDWGNPEAVCRRGKAAVVRRGTRGDNYVTGLPRAATHDPAGCSSGV